MVHFCNPVWLDNIVTRTQTILDILKTEDSYIEIDAITLKLKQHEIKNI